MRAARAALPSVFNVFRWAVRTRLRGQIDGRRRMLQPSERRSQRWQRRWRAGRATATTPPRRPSARTPPRSGRWRMRAATRRDCGPAGARGRGAVRTHAERRTEGALSRHATTPWKRRPILALPWTPACARSDRSGTPASAVRSPTRSSRRAAAAWDQTAPPRMAAATRPRFSFAGCAPHRRRRAATLRRPCAGCPVPSTRCHRSRCSSKPASASSPPATRRRAPTSTTRSPPAPSPSSSTAGTRPTRRRRGRLPLADVADRPQLLELYGRLRRPRCRRRLVGLAGVAARGGRRAVGGARLPPWSTRRAARAALFECTRRRRRARPSRTRRARARRHRLPGAPRRRPRTRALRLRNRPRPSPSTCTRPSASRSTRVQTPRAARRARQARHRAALHRAPSQPPVAHRRPERARCSSSCRRCSTGTPPGSAASARWRRTSTTSAARSTARTLRAAATWCSPPTGRRTTRASRGRTASGRKTGHREKASVLQRVRTRFPGFVFGTYLQTAERCTFGVGYLANHDALRPLPHGMRDPPPRRRRSPTRRPPTTTRRGRTRWSSSGRSSRGAPATPTVSSFFTSKHKLGRATLSSRRRRRWPACAAARAPTTGATA